MCCVTPEKGGLLLSTLLQIILIFGIEPFFTKFKILLLQKTLLNTEITRQLYQMILGLHTDKTIYFQGNKSISLLQPLRLTFLAMSGILPHCTSIFLYIKSSCYLISMVPQLGCLFKEGTNIVHSYFNRDVCPGPSTVPAPLKAADTILKLCFRLLSHKNGIKNHS